jgi:hypothetical protein
MLTGSVAIRNKKRSLSASEAIGKRDAQLKPRHESLASVTNARTRRANSSSSNTQPQGPNHIEVAPVSEAESVKSVAQKRNTQAITPIFSAEKGAVQELKPAASWWEKFTGARKRMDPELEHNV